MRVLGLVILASVGGALLGGCKTIYNHTPGRSVTLDGLKTAGTYDVLGPTQGTSGGTSILFGLFTAGFEDKSGDWGGEAGGRGGRSRALSAAHFNAIESLPEADALLASRWVVEEENFLLFSTFKATVKGKGIRYNTTVK
jgi:hypothetical protein